MTLAERLTELRKANNWTQAELAKRTKYDRAYISYLESGQRVPSFDALERLARAFKLQVGEMMEGVK